MKRRTLITAVGSIGAGVTITPRSVTAEPRSTLPPGFDDTNEGNFSFGDDESRISAGDWITYDFKILVEPGKHEEFERFDSECEIADAIMEDVADVEIEAIDDTYQVEADSEYWSDCYYDEETERVAKRWSRSTPPKRPGEYDVSFKLQVYEDVEYLWPDEGTHVSETTLIIERGR